MTWAHQPIWKKGIVLVVGHRFQPLVGDAVGVAKGFLVLLILVPLPTFPFPADII